MFGKNRYMEKPRMYEASGVTLALVATELGVKLGNVGINEWSGIMRSLAECDSIAESNPGFYSEIANLASQLGVRDSEEMYAVLKRLLDESYMASDATNYADHLNHRELEARACADILRLSSTQYEGSARPEVWSQIGHLAAAGIMLDTVCDGVMDSRAIVGQFTARQLMFGGALRFVGLAKKVHPHTWRVTIKASHRTGLDRHIAGKPLRVFREFSAYRASQEAI
jgi:hypothetical protein